MCVEVGQWGSPRLTRALAGLPLKNRAGQGLDGGTLQRVSCRLTHQRASDADVCCMQPLVIGIATTATVLILLRQQAVSIAVVLLDHKVKLRCQVLVDDDLDVSGLV
ncbi:hypothetical protein D3C79_940510 [compost metagenome]